jgi:hypothetical protein
LHVKLDEIEKPSVTKKKPLKMPYQSPVKKSMFGPSDSPSRNVEAPLISKDSDVLELSKLIHQIESLENIVANIK